jgi:hypothetical protein
LRNWIVLAIVVVGVGMMFRYGFRKVEPELAKMECPPVVVEMGTEMSPQEAREHFKELAKK